MSGNLKQKIRKIVDRIVSRVSFLSGDVLVERGVDRQLGFIFYCFALVCIIIAWSLMVEQSLVRVQKNDKQLQELRISYQQRTLDIVGMNNRTRIDKMLKDEKSKLHAPEQPPKRIVLKEE